MTKRDTVTVTVNQEPTAFAGNNATYPNTVPLFPAAGTASNYSSVKWFTDGDGHFNIDTVPASLYYPGTADKNNGGVDLALKAYPLGTCADTASSTVHITLSFPQGIGTPFHPASLDLPLLLILPTVISRSLSMELRIQWHQSLLLTLQEGK